MTKVVNCPHCGELVEWKVESKWRPFCTERCRLIDLGAWADEQYSIATQEASPMDDLALPDNLKND